MSASREKSESYGFQPKRKPRQAKIKSKGHRIQSGCGASPAAARAVRAAIRRSWTSPGNTLSPEQSPQPGPPLPLRRKTTGAVLGSSRPLAGSKKKATSKTIFFLYWRPPQENYWKELCWLTAMVNSHSEPMVTPQHLCRLHLAPAPGCLKGWRRSSVRTEIENKTPNRYRNLLLVYKARKGMGLFLPGLSCLLMPPAWNLGHNPLPALPVSGGMSAHISLLSFHRKVLMPQPEERESSHGTNSLADCISEKWVSGRASPRLHVGSGVPDPSPPEGVLMSMESTPCHLHGSLHGPFLHQTKL